MLRETGKQKVNVKSSCGWVWES